MKLLFSENRKADFEFYPLFSADIPDELSKSSFAKSILQDFKNKEFGKEGLECLLLNLPERKILLVSLGKEKDYDVEILRRATAIAFKSAKEAKAKSIRVVLPNKLKNEESAYAVAESLLLSDYEFTIKSENKKHVVEEASINARVSNSQIAKLAIVSEAVKYVRTLVNTPACIATPSYLAKEAKKIARQHRLKLEILHKKELAKKGMNGILAVGSGSANEPVFVSLSYRNPKAKTTVAFVGKGLCFDSGGLQIKSHDAMLEMKDDKSGAALALGLIKAVAGLKMPVNLIAAFGAVENMPGCLAYKPRDVIKSYSGKTIEVMHTDAEGRIVLADCLAYVNDVYKPDLIIDAATLTGACHIALGSEAAAIFGTAKKEIAQLKEIGEKLRERLWELPAYKEYEKAIKSDIADIANSSKPGTGAGTITAALFLKNFVGKTPWIHIDIASVAYLQEAKYYVPKYGTGFGIRLLVDFFEKI